VQDLHLVCADTGGSPTWDELLPRFLECGRRRKRPETTLSSYDRSLRFWATAFATRGLPSPRDVTSNDV
jgi:hypothetical protein